jgi:hypothetical protein
MNRGSERKCDTIGAYFAVPYSTSEKVLVILYLDVIVKHFDTTSYQVFAVELIECFKLHVFRTIAEDGYLFSQYKNTRTVDVIIKSDREWSEFVSVIIYCLPVLCKDCNLKLNSIKTILPFTKDTRKKNFPGYMVSEYLKRIYIHGEQHANDKDGPTIYLERKDLNKIGLKVIKDGNKFEELLLFQSMIKESLPSPLIKESILPFLK